MSVFRFDTQDGLYDLAFSEVHEHQVATASGDGSVKLWDMTLNVSFHVPGLQAGCHQPPDQNADARVAATMCGVSQDFPLRKWHEHTREVFSIDWSNMQKEVFCTASWDQSIKLVSLSAGLFIPTSMPSSPRNRHPSVDPRPPNLPPYHPQRPLRLHLRSPLLTVSAQHNRLLLN